MTTYSFKHALFIFVLFLCIPVVFSGCGLTRSNDANTTSQMQVTRVSDQKEVEDTQEQLPPQPKVSTTTMLFVGDIMLDRSVWLKTKAAGDYNHPFVLIDPLFEQYDVRVANLEGPITSNRSIANGTGGARFTFTFSPEFLDPLKKRFEILSLANNHTHNFGRSGLEQTRNFLTEKDITFFGDPWNTEGHISVTTTYNDITFAFVGFHELIGSGFEDVVEETKRLDPLVDVVVAMPHWGPEYITDSATVHQTREAHAFIDAGADLIIGAHPHVVQPIEIYKDRVIFYSLGNFIFDQYFSEETMTGLAVGTDIRKQEDDITFSFDLIPLDINTQSQPSVASEAKRQRVLQHLRRTSKVDDEVRNKIEEGRLNMKIVNK